MLTNGTHSNMTLLADYCRTGHYTPIAGVNQDNVHHYRRLVFNNVLDSVTAAYPLARKLIKRKAWEKLVERFFAAHRVQHPQIWMMPEEFKDYVIQHETTLVEKFPCLPNLLEMEWLEIEVFMMPDIAVTQNRVPGCYYLNPEIRLLKTEYPVHLAKAATITTEDQGTYFVSLHRDPQTGAVRFTNLTLPFADVLEHLNQQPLTENEVVDILTKYADAAKAATAASHFLEQSVLNHLIFT